VAARAPPFGIGKIKSDKEKEPKRNYKNRKLSTGVAGSLSAKPMVGRTKFLTYGKKEIR